MKTVVIGHHDKSYLIAVNQWAKRLEAEEVVIYKNGSVTLNCRYGNICEDYKPSAKELRRA